MSRRCSLLILCAVLVGSSCKSDSDPQPDGAAGPDVGVADHTNDRGVDSSLLETSSEVALEVPLADRAFDISADGMSSLAACFKDVPAPVGTYQLVTKRSADGKITVQMALDTEDRLGTSGTSSWNLVRFGIEQEGVTTCVRDRAELKYRPTHHNCSDTATVDVAGVRYDMQTPDRDGTRISASMGTTKLWGPVTLMDVTCIPDRDTPKCRSGGPC